MNELCLRRTAKRERIHLGLCGFSLEFPLIIAKHSYPSKAFAGTNLCRWKRDKKNPNLYTHPPINSFLIFYSVLQFQFHFNDFMTSLLASSSDGKNNITQFVSRLKPRPALPPCPALRHPVSRFPLSTYFRPWLTSNFYYLPVLHSLLARLRFVGPRRPMYMYMYMYLITMAKWIGVS